MNFSSRLDRSLAWAERTAILVFVAIAFVIGLAQVVLRYCFGLNLEWGTYLFIFATVAAMLMAGSLAVRDDRHVSIDHLQTILPQRAGRALRLAAYLAAFALAAIYLYCAVRFLLFLYGIGLTSSETNLPEWPFYTIMPVAMAMFCLRYLIRLHSMLTGREPQPAEAGLSLEGLSE